MLPTLSGVVSLCTFVAADVSSFAEYMTSEGGIEIGALGACSDCDRRYVERKDAEIIAMWSMAAI